METFNGFRMVPVSGSGGPGMPGAQGPQGYQGAEGHSGLQWTAQMGTLESIYPNSGEMNVYSEGNTLQVSFNTTTAIGADSNDWFSDIKTAAENDAGLFTIAQVSNRSVHRTIKVLEVSDAYASGGSSAVTIIGEVVSSAGNIYYGRSYFGHYSPLGAVGLRGFQGYPETIPGPQGNQGATGDRGPYGHLGVMGVQGMQGYQGFPGVPSSDSEPGPIGYQGNPGPATGYQGNPGVTGNTGAQGIQGSTGPRGNPGHPGRADQGDRGSQGSQGSAGPQGLRGMQGSTGATGGIGQTGYTGGPGPQGNQGSQSAAEGPRGSSGAPGARGDRGHQGSAGPQGDIGFVGIPGPDGTRGPQGYQGTNFSISKVYSSEAERTSATGGNLPGDGEYAVIGGDETSSDYGKLYLYTTSGGWTYKSDMSMQGIQGPTGNSGDVGPQGYAGHPGLNITGDRGVQGSAGPQGSQGFQGYQGVLGVGGSQGVQGDPGPTGYQGSTVLAPDGTGIIYISGGTPEVVTLDAGLTVSGSLNSRVLRYRCMSARPTLDSNHIHVYNCDEAPGSTVLVDSGTGGKNLTLAGGEGTLYSLNTYRFGSSVPWIRCLVDGSSSPFASNNTMSITGRSVTMEAVVSWTSRTDGAANRNIIQLRTSDDVQALYTETYNGYIYGLYHVAGPSIYGGGDAYTSQTVRPELNKPYHVMFVWDTTNPSGAYQYTLLYINGVLTNQGAAIGPAGTLNVNNLILGGQSLYNGRSTQFYIRDVRISNVARSATYAFETAKALLSL